MICMSIVCLTMKPGRGATIGGDFGNCISNLTADPPRNENNNIAHPAIGNRSPGRGQAGRWDPWARVGAG